MTKQHLIKALSVTPALAGKLADIINAGDGVEFGSLEDIVRQGARPVPLHHQWAAYRKIYACSRLLREEGWTGWWETAYDKPHRWRGGNNVIYALHRDMDRCTLLFDFRTARFRCASPSECRKSLQF